VKQLCGRLVAYVFLGSFCVAGPLLLILALGAAVQRGALVIFGLHAEATVVGMRSMGATAVNYAPVFQFTANDGRTHTVSSDVYGKDSAVRYGERIAVLYSPEHPESARIDSFAQLWTLPLVLGVVGAGLSVMPAILWVAWLRRRADAAAPEERDRARAAADRISLGFRRTLGVGLIGGGGVLFAVGLGVISSGQGSNTWHVPAVVVGVLLAACGAQIGEWTTMGSRLSYVFGSLAITSFAVMFGWVALYGDAANFHGSMGANGIAVSSSSALPARVAFGIASTFAGLASFWAWRQVLRSTKGGGR
jgi:hypothetical protein